MYSIPCALCDAEKCENMASWRHGELALRVQHINRDCFVKEIVVFLHCQYYHQ